MKYLILILVASAFSAHASYYVECGNKMLADGSGFQTVKFKASSGDDKFTGRNGENWSVALAGDWVSTQVSVIPMKTVFPMLRSF